LEVVKALITGGAGFIGSHLADLLLSQRHQVILLDDLSTGRYENIQHLLGRRDVEFVLGSILNADLVDDLMARSDVCYHLAAAVGVKLIVERPLQSLMTNIRGSEIVFEKAHKYGTRVLVTSTSEIYGKNTSDRLSEEDDRILGSPLKSRWSYSEAKAIDEILAYTYWREKGLETVIVRLFNTVGPRQTGSYGMVIPRFVSQALRGDAITVYGTGEQTRCFCYVGDVVGGMVALCEHPRRLRPGVQPGWCGGSEYARPRRTHHRRSGFHVEARVHSLRRRLRRGLRRHAAPGARHHPSPQPGGVRTHGRPRRDHRHGDRRTAELIQPVQGGWWQYTGVFVASALLSLLLTPLAIRLAFRRGVLDKPGGHKSHTSPVPYLGGLAIVAAFAVAVLVAAFIDSSTGHRRTVEGVSHSRGLGRAGSAGRPAQPAAPVASGR
jgi:UDP-glucose 4-epimerase